MYTVAGKIHELGEYEGLPNVSIIEVGKTDGAITNSLGAFVLVVPSAISLIRISHLGFKDQVMTAGSFQHFVTLVPDPQQLAPTEITGGGKDNTLLYLGLSALGLIAIVAASKKTKPAPKPVKV